ncbi:hypothetical protein ACI6QG_05390 [Roseococcus sp. DSY-14]|uniref:hypothetical protein n=1 Tax=Roseococcus sp. DSY-14 TaxID=3369650 RepID=UPI00387B5277
MTGAVEQMGGKEDAGMNSMASPWAEGTRIGRFVIVRDADGICHAICATGVFALCDAGDGATVLLLGGGRMLRVEQDLPTVLSWLEMGARP